MITINKDEAIIKILDIEHSSIPFIKYRLDNRLAGMQEYMDSGRLREHLYTQEIIDKLEGHNIKIDDDLRPVLEEIQKLCDKHGCSYFRIINLPLR